jgi:SAM-dependent methyltransferase
MPFGEQTGEGAARIRALVQAVSDLVRPGSFDGLRVLDLGAGDGSIAAELALRGASVIAVEGRERNAVAIREQRDRHGIDADRLRVEVTDVRRLDWQSLGTFDVVVCSGLLYHLELADAAALARSMHAACTRLALVDTEVAWGPVERRDGYLGHHFREHPAERLASLDNEQSFWLTRASLHALLHDAGFASTWGIGAPGQPRRKHRTTVAALVGDRIGRLAIEPDRELPAARPEEPAAGRVDRARIGLARLRARGRS